jgi:hypothetical protein
MKITKVLTETKTNQETAWSGLKKIVNVIASNLATNHATIQSEPTKLSRQHETVYVLSVQKDLLLLDGGFLKNEAI